MTVRPSPKVTYLLADTASGMRRHALLVAALATTTAVSLILLASTLLVGRQVDLVASHLTGQVEVTVFLCTGRTCPAPDDDAVDRLETTITEDPRVAAVTYESPDQARDRLAEAFIDSPDLVADVPAAALPGTFRITLTDPADAAAVGETYRAAAGVETVVDHQDLLDGVVSASRLARTAMAGLAAIQLAIGVAITSTVVRLSALTRARRMRIMTLVGATRTYIHAPYLLEAAAAATAGATIGAALIGWATPTVIGHAADHITFIPYIDRGDVAVVIGQCVAATVGIAVLAAAAAVRRHTTTD